MNELPYQEPRALPLVSILVPTYQHAQFIDTCIRSILAQRTDFGFEVIIGEDGSTDGTLHICEGLAAEWPSTIKLIKRSRKDVMYILGRPTGRANLLQLLREAKGEFVAFCEGDDHWIDQGKLQRQVDSLRSDAAAVGCFTDAFNEKDSVRTRYMAGYARAPEGRCRQEDIIRGQGIPTCTLVFRRSALKGVEEYLKISPVGDTILFTYLTEHGHFIYQPQITGVRVMHPGGIHSLTSEAHKKKVYLTTLPILDKMTHGRHRAIIEDRRNSVLLAAWSAAIAAGDRELARIAWPHIARQRKRFGWNITTTARNFMKAYFPALESTFSRIFRR